MNRRLITVLLGLGLSVGTQAFGQNIAPNLRTASSIAAPEQGSIQKFIEAQITKLASDDMEQQSQGRDALVNAITADPAPSGAFAQAYTKALSDGLLKVAGSENIRTRMNGAIVATRVVAKLESPALRPAIEKFINDTADAVVLWGVKGYRHLIAAQMKSQPQAAADLLKPLVPAIKDNLRGPIAEAAYESLRLNILTERASVTPAMVKAVIPTIQDLLEARIALYQTGMPEAPLVDALGTNFLTDIAVLPQHTPEQRQRSIQLIVELLAAGSGRAASLEGNRDAKASIIDALKLVARGMTLVGDKPAVQSAASPIARMDASMDGPTITKMCNELINAAVTELGASPPKMSLRVMAPGK